jgi:acyl carrier protein
MSARKDIEEKLQEFVVSELLYGDAGGLTPTTNLLALGVIDSLSMVSLRLYVERTFGVRIPDGLQVEDFSTLTAIAAVVERAQRAAAESKG